MTSHNGERWEELPRWQQTGIIALGAVELALTAKAAVDLARRPRRQVRGPKTLWFLSFAVQPFGPIAYLSLGRRGGVVTGKTSPAGRNETLEV
jgi:hypothetical protein